MSGAEFLKLYAAIIFVVCLCAGWPIWAAGPRPRADRPAPSPPLNPRQWAFLRSDSGEVLRLTVFERVVRGHLQILNQPSHGSGSTVEIGPAEASPDTPRLDPGTQGARHRALQFLAGDGTPFHRDPGCWLTPAQPQPPAT
jgi:hypothetical protein